MTTLLRMLLLTLALVAGASAGWAQTVLGAAKVIDGDTIALQGLNGRVRLSNIDAPETAQTCENARGSLYPCGAMATDELRALIGDGAKVSCRIDGTDRYGRALATCSSNGAELNAAMVASGWAVEFTQYSNGRYSQYQEQAKSAGRGLWQGSFVQPWEWRDRKRAAEQQDDDAQAALDSPTECAIKGNVSRNGRIYHLPGQEDYDRVRIDADRGERMFCSEEEARAAGWRRAAR